MNRRVGLIVLIVVSLAAVGTAAELPPGKWWRNPPIARSLAITPEQQLQLDQIFAGAADELIDRRADVAKLAVALRAELDRPQLNRQNIQRVAAQLTEARGRMFERELMMLIDMRGVLRDEQWSRLRAHLDRRRHRKP